MPMFTLQNYTLNLQQDLWFTLRLMTLLTSLK